MRPRKKEKNRYFSGFTLLELLIAISIIAILTAITVPIYRQYILKSQRSDAKAVLLRIQIEEAKYRVNQPIYGTLAQVFGPTTTSPAGHYMLSITNLSANGYTATASAIGTQLQDTENGINCAVMSVNVNGATSTFLPNACW